MNDYFMLIGGFYQELSIEAFDGIYHRIYTKDKDFSIIEVHKQWGKAYGILSGECKILYENFYLRPDRSGLRVYHNKEKEKLYAKMKLKYER